jgi:chromosome segregation ATPase
MDQPGNHILPRGNQPGAADRMRELLARTVQDHMADQRSNAGALEGIRQQMEGLEWVVNELRQREIPGMTARLDRMAHHLSEGMQKAPLWAESLAEHMELLRAQVDPAADMHPLWADIGAALRNVERALPQAVSDIIGQAMEVMRSQGERLDKLQHNATKLQQSMESAAGRFSRLDTAVGELIERTGQLDEDISVARERVEAGFGTLAAQVEEIEKASSGRVSQALETMKASLDGMAEDMAGIDGQVSLLSGQVRVVHGRIERLDERLADTDGKLGSLDATLTAADGKIGSADTRIAALDTSLERLNERLEDQYGRLSAIDSTLGEIGSTLAAANMSIGGTEAALVAVDTKFAALDSRVEGLDRRLGEHGKGLTAVDGKLDTVAARLNPVDSKLSVLDSRLGTVDSKVGTLSSRLDGLDGRLAGVGARIDGLGDRFGALDGKLETANGRLGDVVGQLEALADEVRARPGSTEIQDTLAKIVDAAQNDVTTKLGSLEETVFTLAEALLRPQGQPVPAPRDVPAPREGADL